jgi:hypothetical protein
MLTGNLQQAQRLTALLFHLTMSYLKHLPLLTPIQSLQVRLDLQLPHGEALDMQTVAEADMAVTVVAVEQSGKHKI